VRAARGGLFAPRLGVTSCAHDDAPICDELAVFTQVSSADEQIDRIALRRVDRGAGDIEDWETRAAKRRVIVTVRLGTACWGALSAHLTGRRPLAIRSILRAIGAAPRPARQPRLTLINITAGCNQREQLK
jgi:hypothetical protein